MLVRESKGNKIEVINGYVTVNGTPHDKYVIQASGDMLKALQKINKDFKYMCGRVALTELEKNLVESEVQKYRERYLPELADAMKLKSQIRITEESNFTRVNRMMGAKGNDCCMSDKVDMNTMIDKYNSYNERTRLYADNFLKRGENTKQALKLLEEGGDFEEAKKLINIK